MAGNARAHSCCLAGPGASLVDVGVTRKRWLPPVPGKGMSGQPEVYRPLAGGKIACTSPSAASTVRAGGRVNVRKNRAGSCLNQTTSTLSIRGYAIGRWSRFKPWQGGSANAADRVREFAHALDMRSKKKARG